MKGAKILFVLITFAMQFACAASAQQVKAVRKPFQKSPYIIKQPEPYPSDELDSGKVHDPKPRVVLVDEKAGKYEFRWIGNDGKEKIVPYQRHDAIDAVVTASIKKTDDRKLLFTYQIHILPTSPVYFRNFIVQTFGFDATPVRVENRPFLTGDMTNSISFFRDGVWWSFGFIGNENERLWGGNTIEFELTSSSQPGIVNCKAVGGEIATKGVGEELPQELEDEIPIFEDYATGYTIGPVASLSGLSKPDRAKYILDNLPKFIEAGWMGESTAKIYESILKKEDLSGAFRQAKSDLENEFITSEVFHIIEGLQ